MNYITNDKGERVIAVGAPGSIARVKAKYPALLSRLRNNSNWQEELNKAGVEEYEISSLLKASLEIEVFDFVCEFCGVYSARKARCDKCEKEA